MEGITRARAAHDDDGDGGDDGAETQGGMKPGEKEEEVTWWVREATTEGEMKRQSEGEDTEGETERKKIRTNISDRTERINVFLSAGGSLPHSLFLHRD